MTTPSLKTGIAIELAMHGMAYTITTRRANRYDVYFDGDYVRSFSDPDKAQKFCDQENNKFSGALTKFMTTSIEMNMSRF